jgi:catechol 2,3-dioxygenase-like lactoylglutathione lyase family enzyme
MPLQLLEHYTIRSLDMEATRDFYCRAIGLRVGKRPPLAFPGYWLYCGETPVVHLVPLADPKAIRGAVNVPAALGGARPGSGAVDHVAFRATNPAAMRRRLRSHNIAFEDRAQPGGRLTQFFLDDPNGITVEINFRIEPAKRPPRARNDRPAPRRRSR